MDRISKKKERRDVVLLRSMKDSKKVYTNRPSHRFLPFIITLAVMAVIFLHSAMPADLSSAESGLLVRLLASLTHADEILLTFIVRKCGHFTEYLVLGFCLMCCMSSLRRKNEDKPMHDGQMERDGQNDQPDSYDRVGSDGHKHFAGILKPACLFWLIGVAYAITDEFHQSFVPGRSCELRDVCIDACGVAAGVLIRLLLAQGIVRCLSKRAGVLEQERLLWFVSQRRGGDYEKSINSC